MQSIIKTPITHYFIKCGKYAQQVKDPVSLNISDIFILTLSNQYSK